jgi:hypothetical protein
LDWLGVHLKVDTGWWRRTEGSQGRLAADFVRHAMKLKAERVVLLLKVDFDSAKTRTDLFRDQLIPKVIAADRRGPSRASRWM